MQTTRGGGVCFHMNINVILTGNLLRRDKDGRGGQTNPENWRKREQAELLITDDLWVKDFYMFHKRSVFNSWRNFIDVLSS